MVDKKDKQLYRIVQSFREGILGKQSSTRMCFAICAPLQTILEMSGYQVELVEGELKPTKKPAYATNHYWLKLPDGRIIDPTADQFKTPTGDAMPEVYIGKLPKWYKPLRAA